MQSLAAYDLPYLAVKSTDKFSNFTYQDKLTRSNTQYNTDLIAKLRKQAIKTSKNLYLSGSNADMVA